MNIWPFRELFKTHSSMLKSKIYPSNVQKAKMSTLERKDKCPCLIRYIYTYYINYILIYITIEIYTFRSIFIFLLKLLYLAISDIWPFDLKNRAGIPLKAENKMSTNGQMFTFTL